MNIKIGTVIGNWLVTSEKYKHDNVYWNDCECICGTKKPVKSWFLNNNKTKSCGCTNIKGRFKYEGVGDLSKAYYNSFIYSRLSYSIGFRRIQIYFMQPFMNSSCRNINIFVFYKKFTEMFNIGFSIFVGI